MAAQSAGPVSPLTLEAGATCLQRDRLVARIVHWREGAAIEDSLRVLVRGDPRDATRVFFSVVRRGMEPAERVLENAPADCDQLHSAVALSIALAIDATLAVERSPSLRAALPSEVPEPRASSPQQRSGGWGHLELALLAGASVGLVPSTALVAAPRVQYAPFPWLAFAVEGLGTYAAHLSAGGAKGEFDAGVLAVGVDACLGGETAERLSFFTCAGARAGTFAARGYDFGFLDFRTNRNWWALAGSGQARAWVLPYVGIGIAVEAAFALAERDLVVRLQGDSQPALRRSVPRVGLAISGGPVFRFF